MNLDDITEYIKSNGKDLNVRDLKLCKPWCFRLYGVINSKLSMDRKTVYSRQQIFNELPSITQDIFNTLKSIMIQHFTMYSVPETYSSVNSLYSVFNILDEVPHQSSEQVEQKLVLYLNLAFDYLSVKDLTEDKVLLLKTIIYMLYSSLVYLYNLMGVIFNSVNVKIIFNSFDNKEW